MSPSAIGFGEGGDIHVEYGDNSRWFPLPQPEAKPSFGLFGFRGAGSLSLMWMRRLVRSHECGN